MPRALQSSITIFLRHPVYVFAHKVLIALLSIIRNRVTKENRSRNKARPEAAFYLGAD